MSEMMELDKVLEAMRNIVETELIIKKHIGSQEVEVEGGTGVLIMDIWFVIKALETEAQRMLPIVTDKAAFRHTLHEMVDQFDFGEQERS